MLLQLDDEKAQLWKNSSIVL